MKRGEIWWYERPSHKPRPALILTRDEAIDRLDKLIVVPATGTIRGIATEVGIGADEGLRQDSVLSCDNTTVAPKSLLTERIAMVGPSKMHQVCRALSAALDC